MADFTEDQTKWIKAVAAPLGGIVNGRAPDLLKAFKSDEARQEKREEVLTDILNRLGGFSDELKEAQAFQVTWTTEEKSHFWGDTKTKVRSMNWSEANAEPDENGKVRDSKGKSGAKDKKDRMIRDTEVDTKHDLVGGYQVDPAKAKKALEMHARLVQLQTEMERALDASGKPLFTARDIERELWSPLVKADILPSNAVADKYSQEAQVFSGAAEVYEERLKEYSKKASKHEKAQRVLRIAGDFVQMAGSMASASIKIVEFDGSAMSNADKRELVSLTAQNNTTPFPVDSQQHERLLALKDMKQSSAQALFEQGTVTVAAAFFSGAFDVASKSLDKESETKGWKIAESAADAIAKSAIAAMGVYGTAVGQDKNASQSDKDSAAGMTKTVQSLVAYGLAGSKIIFRLKEALDAPENERDRFIKAMVLALGDGVGSSFAAFDQPTLKNSDGVVTQQGTDGQWGKTGAFVSGAIAGAANIVEIGRVLAKAKAEGREPNWGGLVAACGLSVVGEVMLGTYQIASDKARVDVPSSNTENNPFQETSGEKAQREKGEVAAMQDLAKGMQPLNKMLDALPTERPSEEELARKIAAEANARNTAKTKAELKSLTEEISKDPRKKQALLDSILDESSVKQAEINKLISLATAATATVQATSKNTEAKAAMDTLIAESEACKAKWAALDAITAGGVGLIAAFMPGVGLAVAIRQLVSDVAWLVKKSIELNLWQKNMALTYGNDSVYGPAINSRLANAQIQVSQKAVNFVFSLIGVTAESLKLGDITGAATAVSVGNTMARALSDFGYKMQKEVEIAKGWQLYKKARSAEGQGDRKLARKAMSWNSTLSKCVIAYGIVKDSDPLAAEVARNCGLTPELLSDESDVCQRVVSYFMSVYSDDPVVLRRIPVVKDWHPAIPKLELENWIKFKAAAATKAVPPLSETSLRTTGIDDALAAIDALWKGKGYASRRDELTKTLNEALALAPDDSDLSLFDEDDDEPVDPLVKQTKAALMGFFAAANSAVNDAIKALEPYVPDNGPCPEGASPKWSEGATHRDMSLVVESLGAQAMILRSEIDFDEKAVG